MNLKKTELGKNGICPTKFYRPYIDYNMHLFIVSITFEITLSTSRSLLCKFPKKNIYISSSKTGMEFTNLVDFPN